jgi:hypothetical protein
MTSAQKKMLRYVTIRLKWKSALTPYDLLVKGRALVLNGLSIIYIFKLCNAVMQCHCEPIESYCTILLALMVRYQDVMVLTL